MSRFVFMEGNVMTRRNAMFVLVVLTTVTLVGCSKLSKLFSKKADGDLQTTDMYGGDSYDADSGATPATAPVESAAPAVNNPSFATNATPSYAYNDMSGYPSATSQTASYGTSTVGSRMHVVAKGDTLYSLARSYYNDQSRWKDIFNANRTTVTDPNKIRIGQRLVIP